MSNFVTKQPTKNVLTEKMLCHNINWWILLNLPLSICWFCLFSREQEKELLLLKKGKRPRGRPRKIVVSTIRSRMLLTPSDYYTVSNICCQNLGKCARSSKVKQLFIWLIIVFLRFVLLLLLLFSLVRRRRRRRRQQPRQTGNPGRQNARPSPRPAEEGADCRRKTGAAKEAEQETRVPWSEGMSTDQGRSQNPEGVQRCRSSGSDQEARSPGELHLHGLSPGLAEGCGGRSEQELCEPERGC